MTKSPVDLRAFKNEIGFFCYLLITSFVMVKADGMFKLTLITSCGIQSRARLRLYMYAPRMRQHVNIPL